jgi:hypothetical protein
MLGRPRLALLGLIWDYEWRPSTSNTPNYRANAHRLSNLRGLALNRSTALFIISFPLFIFSGRSTPTVDVSTYYLNRSDELSKRAALTGSGSLSQLINLRIF